MIFRILEPLEDEQMSLGSKDYDWEDWLCRANQHNIT